MEKMTYVKALEIAIAAMENQDEVRVKLEQLLNQLVKKSSTERKPTKTQNANEKLQFVIYASMEVNKPYTITEMIQNIPELGELSNQKVSALVKSLKDCGMVTREENKGKIYFTKVNSDED